MCFLICISLDIYNIFSGEGRSPIQSFVPQSFRLWTWLFYFTLPVTIEKIQKKLKKDIDIGILMALCVGMLVFNVLYELFIGYHLIGIEVPEYFYDNMILISTVSVMFITLKNVNVRNEIVKNLISCIEKCNLGIYIIHLHIGRLVVQVVGVDSILMELVCVVVTFSLSMICTMVMQKIPVVKRVFS